MTQVTAQDRCSALSLTRAEPLAGTATEVSSGYLLIEDQGPWARNALSKDAVGGLAEQIDSYAAGAGVKTLVFRSAGRRESTAARRCFAATVGHNRQLVSFTITDPADLLDLTLDAYASDLSGVHPQAAPDPGPLLLVCTHAKRDQCCAIRGAPLARELAAQHPGRVFECSHLGGHRFAATALALPSGAVYGRLDTKLALDAYRAEEGAQVIAPQLRGMSHLPPAAQTVDAALRVRLALSLIDDVHLVDCTQTQDDSGMYEVRMSAAGTTWFARVSLTRSEPAPQSCGAAVKSAKLYEVRELRRVPMSH